VIRGIPAGAVSCDTVEARFVAGPDGDSLRQQALRAEAEGSAAVIVRPGPLGDPVVLAAGLGPALHRVLVGACVEVGVDGRHPALVARELTSLDHVCGGRSLLCCAPPFDDALAEALALCRAMWREGRATSDGPAFPAPDARHRPGPTGPTSPAVALDLTEREARVNRGVAGPAGAHSVPDSVRALADFVLWPVGAGDPAVCRMEHL
jgi:alkanesulfonate monooxygenase SsuD/methylene tetrahydromethanopterin reductase-like flavin-dependent oxidoreductase (luciferase family)